MKKIAPKGSSETFIRQNSTFCGDECLIWPYRKVQAGYGLAVIGGVQKRASRWMCIIAHGNPPTAKHVAAHNCGNPSCVNPRHLRWATDWENSQDREIHGTVNRGERNGKSKLTRSDVAFIRAAPPDLAPLMERFRMSKHGLSKIRSGSRWGHI